MEAIKMLDGELIFSERVNDLEEFLQRWVNTLKIDAHECFYNELLGLDKRLIDNQRSNICKLEHIKAKTLALYGDELEDLYYKIISEKERTLKAEFYFRHKKYKEFRKEVGISDNKLRD